MDQACKYSEWNSLGDQQLPVLWVNISNTPQYLSEDRLLSLYTQFLRNQANFSISSLLLPYWIGMISPLKEIDAHIPRGRSRHEAFINKYALRIVSALNSINSLRNKKSDIICAASSGNSNAIEIDIVIPRCCESIKGDLVWVTKLMSNRSPSLKLRLFVYYKCPWCVPRSHLTKWTAPCESNYSQLLSRAECMQRDRIIQQHGGIHLLDELTGSVGGASLIESQAFDLLGPNAKEATAYLAHLTRQYDSVASYTIFMHTQPAHHLACERFYRLIVYLSRCGSLPVAVDYMSINFRWFEGTWAHQPERCSMSLLHHLFRHGTALNSVDPERTPFASDDIKAFLAVPMASAVAAQFLVSRAAIQRRPLIFWQELQALTNGSSLLPGCLSSPSPLGWSEVASALERLWHTFFRNTKTSAMSKGVSPLYSPDVAMQMELPKYLRDTPVGGCELTDQLQSHRSQSNTNLLLQKRGSKHLLHSQSQRKPRIPS